MKSVPFLEAFRDITSQYSKIPKSKFVVSGSFPIIDQGKGKIAGYFDDVTLAVDRGEVVVFGDHTRAVKFAKGPFAVGADGTKVLMPVMGLFPRYAYRWLEAQDVPSLGYSRHFKLLKELAVPVCNEAEQRRIADILDKADALRNKRRETIAQLDALGQSIFHEMFGGSETAQQVILADVLRNGLRNGLSPSTSGVVAGEVLTLGAITGSELDLSQKKAGFFDSDFHAEQLVRPGKILICRGNGNKHLVGKGKVVHDADNRVGYPDTIIAGDINTSIIEPMFLQTVWESPDVRGQIERGARTTNGTFKVNQSLLGSINFPLPSRDLQRRFVNRIAAIERLKAKHLVQLVELDKLFLSVRDRAFRGDL